MNNHMYSTPKNTSCHGSNNCLLSQAKSTEKVRTLTRHRRHLRQALRAKRCGLVTEEHYYCEPGEGALHSYYLR
jgi:hypothetical protein